MTTIVPFGVFVRGLQGEVCKLAGVAGWYKISEIIFVDNLLCGTVVTTQNIDSWG